MKKENYIKALQMLGEKKTKPKHFLEDWKVENQMKEKNALFLFIETEI